MQSIYSIVMAEGQAKYTGSLETQTYDTIIMFLHKPYPHGPKREKIQMVETF
jgi:hypothetical protein